MGTWKCCQLSQKFSFVSMISMTATFFLVEIVVGYLTNSMALVADSFHMLSDVVSLFVGFIALRYSKLGKQNGRLVGSFVGARSRNKFKFVDLFLPLIIKNKFGFIKIYFWPSFCKKSYDTKRLFAEFFTRPFNFLELILQYSLTRWQWNSRKQKVVSSLIIFCFWKGFKKF